jgi:PadR family transcriptional regulator, regulatory protein PadR
MNTSEFFNNWATQLRKGLLELSILNVLRSRRLYGYDIVRFLREIEGLMVSEGTIYPLLSRLKKEDFVRTTLEESTEGPARKYYELTDRGARQLAAMNAHWDKVQEGLATLRKEQ